MKFDYDAIVIGAGGVGSAAAWQLARRGASVLAIDRYCPPHDRGSSHGQTRIFRRAYFEHPNYVPLTQLAAAKWAELESLTSRRLYTETGLLQVGPADGFVLRGVMASAQQYGLEIDELTDAEIETRWPGLCVPSGMKGLFERHAGYLLVEECVRSQIEAAQAAGARFLFDAEVVNWTVDNETITVHLDSRDFRTSRLVLASGAWARDMLSPLGIELRILRKVLFWYACNDPHMTPAAGTPVFLYELPSGVFYGFSMIDDRGVKVAEHSGGTLVDDPRWIDRQVSTSDRQPVEAFLRTCLPTVSSTCTDQTVCMYAMSPDEHFIVDVWPDDPRVVIAAALSGHGFKFTPILGEAIADLALAGRTQLPMEFLSLRRFDSSK